MTGSDISELRDKARELGYGGSADVLFETNNVAELERLIAEHDTRNARMARYAEMVGQSPWTWSVAEIIALEPEVFEDNCKAMDWQKHNSHRVVFQAKRCGVPSLIAEAQRILDAHLAAEELSSELLIERNTVVRNIMELPSYTNAVALAKLGYLKNDFPGWDMTQGLGWPVAHEAATRPGALPADFSHWDIMDTGTGMTVAHVAARHGTLPVGFDGWDSEDLYGDTVAKVAAEFNKLPKDFDQWDLVPEGMRPEGWKKPQPLKMGM